jgi:hypothetical protein
MVIPSDRLGEVFNKVKGFEPEKKIAATDAERLLSNLLVSSAAGRNGNITAEDLRKFYLDKVRQKIEQAQS